MVAAHSEDAVYVLPGSILNAPLEGSESAAAEVPLAPAEPEDEEVLALPAEGVFGIAPGICGLTERVR